MRRQGITWCGGGGNRWCSKGPVEAPRWSLILIPGSTALIKGVVGGVRRCVCGPSKRRRPSCTARRVG